MRRSPLAKTRLCAACLVAAVATLARVGDLKAQSSDPTGLPGRPPAPAPAARPAPPRQELPREEMVDRHRFQTNIGDEHFVPVPRASASYFRDENGQPPTDRLSFFTQPANGPLLDDFADEPEPRWLRRPDDSLMPEGPGAREPQPEPWVFPSFLRPTGFAGRSRILPTEPQTSPHFVPMEDRWRIGSPSWDRYGRGTALPIDTTFASGALVNPYRQNVLKGDYPIYGQHTFLNFSVVNSTLFEGRQLPTATTPFESTRRPHHENFFGNPNQFFFLNDTALPISLLHGDAAFKPPDWQIKATPIFNENYLAVHELGVTNPDVRQGTRRPRSFVALQEWFFEGKLADYGPNYDFVSVRAGAQPFTSDFRGFVFSDINRMVRLFGTRLSNRDQFNLIWVKQVEKDTNSFLNTFHDRHELSVIANYTRQDFLFPGYNSQLSFLYNDDGPSFLFDKNNFLVRPDPVGVYAPHQVQAYYFGWGGDGHINRVNISHQFYYVTGADSLNPLAGRSQIIEAYMAAIELSYDQDWVRYRTSFFFASGDGNPKDGKARGFDTILDNPQFAGGQFSYWLRQAIPLQGVNLTNRLSLVPDLRSSKFQGQSNFVNPGLYLFNLGIDFDLTPKLKLINNCNFLWFDKTQTLEQFTFQENIRHFIGVDLSAGVEYRPFLSNNIVMIGGIAGLLPGQGFKDLYNPLRGTAHPMAMGFFDMALVY
ncbi:MAG TPA: hypothetical protein VF306_18005 [Pirellulales bacterium]